MKKLLILLLICSYFTNLKSERGLKPAPDYFSSLETRKIRTQKRQEQQRLKVVWGKRLVRLGKKIAEIEKQLSENVDRIDKEKTRTYLSNYIQRTLLRTHQLVLQKTPNAVFELIKIEKKLERLNALPINELTLEFDPLEL